MSKERCETIQIMPPAVPTWAVYKLEDGTCCVDRVHAWGLERITINGPGITATSIAPYVIDWNGMLTSVADVNNFAGTVEAETEAEAITKGKALAEAENAK